MRFAISRYPKVALIAALALSAPAAVKSDQAELSLSLPQARDLAAYALREDQPDLALRMADGLLLANPREAYAHYVRAVAFDRLNRPRDGRRAAARAYRFADAGPEKLRAAELAARLAYAENRPTLAQIWLRRTAIYAATPRDQQQIASDYQTLRRLNPWSASLQGELRPSNNVNNGTNSTTNFIDGRPDPSPGNPETLALSGMVGSLDLNLSYRLRANPTSATFLGARVYVSRVSLSQSAKALAPGINASKFGSTYTELSLRHSFAAGPPEKRGSAAVELDLGESYYSGQRSFRFARLSGERNWRLSPNTGLQMSLMAEHRFDARYRANMARVLGLGVSLNHTLAGGDRVGLSFSLRDSKAQTPATSGTYTSVGLRANYAFAHRLGPAKVSVGLSVGASDYPWLGVAGSAATGLIYARRKDNSVNGDVTFFFEDFDYAGFAPLIRIRAGQNRSNVTYFSSREVSVSLGIQSKF